MAKIQDRRPMPVAVTLAVTMGLLYAFFQALPAAAQSLLDDMPYVVDAFSQEYSDPSPRAHSLEIDTRQFLLNPNRNEDDFLSFSSRSPFIKARALGNSRLTRFTLLAGMFMGRVSAFAIGNMRIAFNIELK